MSLPSQSVAVAPESEYSESTDITTLLSPLSIITGVTVTGKAIGEVVGGVVSGGLVTVGASITFTFLTAVSTLPAASLAL